MSDEKEIIIVRRRKGGHDAHHGGVWKIAFADFMTAMMAFFLVLWIVNSTSKETRSSIARYFNPIKLTDSTPARKGLQDSRETDFENLPVTKVDPKESKKTPKNGQEGQKQEAGAGPGQQTINQPNTSRASNQTPSPNTSPGESPREEPPAVDASKPHDPFQLLRPKIDWQAYGEANAPRLGPKPETVQARARTNLPTELPSSGTTSADDKPATAAGGEGRGAGNAISTQEPQAGSLGATVQAILKQEQDILGETSIQIREFAEGTLISLLDNNRRAMFQSGSADLTPEAAASLGRIAKAISSLPNGVIISGYTDSSPYRRGQRSNWQLSAMRAESALNVLVSSGVGPNRIERIEGHADRNPRHQGDKEPQNRRIDILLRKTNG
jgi:chemotaxis protein MotB